MVANKVHGAVDRATSNNGFEYAARIGYSTSGVLHLIIAYIVLRLAFGSGGNADQSGALATLAAQPGGAVALWVPPSGCSRWRCGDSPKPSSVPIPTSLIKVTTVLRRHSSGSSPSAWPSSTSGSR